MNPLSMPWSAGPQLPPKKQEVAGSRPYAGPRAAAAEQAQGRPKIHIEARGLSSRAGSYPVAYCEGQALKQYLDLLGLKHTAIYAAIYDVNHPDRGRLRLTYVPSADSHILICPPGYGLNSGWQRTEVDVYKLMAKMKG